MSGTLDVSFSCTLSYAVESVSLTTRPSFNEKTVRLNAYNVMNLNPSGSWGKSILDIYIQPYLCNIVYFASSLSIKLNNFSYYDSDII